MISRHVLIHGYASYQLLFVAFKAFRLHYLCCPRTYPFLAQKLKKGIDSTFKVCISIKRQKSPASVNPFQGCHQEWQKFLNFGTLLAKLDANTFIKMLEKANFLSTTLIISSFTCTLSKTFSTSMSVCSFSNNYPD